MHILALLLLVLQPAAPAVKTMSELMIDPIYPASDAIFYISTRTPATNAAWRELDAKTAALADAAKALQCHQHDRPNSGRPPSALASSGHGPVSASASAQASAAASAVPAPTSRAPDLAGVWSFATLTPLERNAEFAEKPTLTDEEALTYEKRTVERTDRDRRDTSSPAADLGGAYNEFWWERGSKLTVVNGRKRTSLIVDPADGKIPALTRAGQQRADTRAADRRDHGGDGPENRSLAERCLLFGAGPPMVPGPYNNYVQIFQFPDHVVILNEMIHDARIVPLDGRPHMAPAIRQWLGDSRGRYEGNTLVVDTTNFTDKTNFRGADEQLHLVERFTRVGAGALLYEFTIDNPTAFTKPWSAAIGMTKTDDRIFEYACHEANYAMTGILRGARAQERNNR